MTYKAELTNTGGARAGVVASLSSLVPAVKPVDGQGSLHFAPVPANSKVWSTDTFTILVDRSVPFTFDNLQWLFVNPVANPGMDRTAAVGSTVNLDGSGSTNPSGIGTLTYFWSYASKPPGSAALIANSHNITASFVIDLPGNYIVNLTVDNGTAQDTRSVKISTVNSPPVAKAGPNQSVAVASTVNLSGSGSFDVDGDPLTYTWTFVSVPPGSHAVSDGIGSFRSVNAFFVPDVAGTYIVQLVVNDGKADSAASTVTITAGGGGNTAPVANAGPNQSGVSIGATVQLNGSGSTDVDSDPLTYKWTLITVPSGSTAQLNNLNIVNPTFVADKAGQYVAQLIVNDGKIDSAASTVTINTATPPGEPTANAGPGQTVAHGTTVTLNGSGTDPQNLPLTYSWSLTTKPSGSAAVLSNTTIPNPTFVADLPGPYVAQLIVNNGTKSSQPSMVTITTTNTPPVANPGQNQSVSINSLVSLNGGGSTDADNDPLTYSWSFSSRPNGSNASLSAANSKTPTFVADVAGPYVVQLIVNDGFGPSDPKTVTITANAISDIIVPATLTVAPGQMVPYNVTLAQPLATDLDITLQSSDPSKAALANGLITILAGQTQPLRQVLLTGGTAGTATITASALNHSSATTQVTVQQGTITLSITNTSLYLWLPQTLTVQISQVAPAGGTAVTLLADSKYLDIPATVTIPQGQTQATVQVRGVQVGSPTIGASAAGYASPTPLIVNVGATIAWNSPTATFPSDAQNPFVLLTLYATVPGGTNFNPNDGIVVEVTSTRPDVANPQHATSTFYWDGSTAPSLKIFLNVFSPGTTTLKAKGTNIPEVSMTVTVTGPLGISTPSLPDGTSGAAYSTTVLAAGGATPYHWSATGLPANLTIDPTTGVISGTPATDGTFAVKVTVTDTSSPQLTASANYSLKIVKPTATSIAVSSGSGQSAKINAAFASPLKAIVKDVNGNPVSGIGVTFTAPGSGASGTFAGGVNTATTDVNGIATSAVFTANGTKGGPYNVAAAVTSNPALTTNFSLTNLTGDPASIAVSSGSSQSAQTSTAFAQTLKAIVKDSGGNPVSGVGVTFTAPGSGASGTFAGGVNTATTDANGIATSAVFTANGTVGGPYNVAAAVTSNPALTTNFSLTNTPGTAASISIVSGNNQSTENTKAFANPLKVLVKDANNNPVSGVTVTFTIQAGGNGATATFAGGVNTATTDANGNATSAVLTANDKIGTFSVVAQAAAGVTVSFTLNNTVGAPASIAVSSGSPQSAKINIAFASPLKAIVKDAGGNPVSGVSVTFTAPAQSGPSGTFAGGLNTATTDANGIATSTVFTANSNVGGAYNVAAAVTSTPAITTNFSLTNTQGDPASIAVSAGNNQSTKITTAFGSPLKVLVKDASNSVLSGVTVTFTVQAGGSGAAATFAGGVNTATTDVNGIATSAVLTANDKVGAFSVVAQAAAGVTTNFSLTNTTGDPASIAINGGSSQTTQVGTAFGSALKVIVKDAGGNPVNNVSVTFTAPAQSGASLTFAGGVNTATTDPNGIATSQVVTANGVVGGPYNVAASVTASPAITVNLVLTNSPGAAATLTVLDGTAQSAPVNTAFAKLLKVVVKDSFGNVVPGFSVTFTAPAGNVASGKFANNLTSTTASSDGSGIATSTVFTANAIPGNYTVMASGTNVQAVSFLLTNTTTPATSIVVTGGTSPQSTLINTLFPNVLKVLVKDTNGNPVNGLTVKFTPIPNAGASGAFAGNVDTAVTDASGIASSQPFTANGKAGAFTVRASDSTNSNLFVDFAMTNVPGSPCCIAVVSGSGQSVATNTDFPLPLKAVVTDGGGNLLRGVTVTFTAPASGPSGTFLNGTNTTTVITDSAGIATSTTFRSNGTASGNGGTTPYSVVASMQGVGQTASFSLTNSGVNGGAGTILVTNATIGKDLQSNITITLDPPAPNGLPLTIKSLDSSKALVGNSFPQFTTTLLEGTTSLGTVVQALTGTGQVGIEISAPNYNTATATITFAPSAFVISGPNGIGTAFETTQGATTTLSVLAVRLSSGVAAQTQQLRTGLSATVPVSSTVTSVGTLVQSNGFPATSVTVAGGSSSATINFKANSGNTGATDVVVNNAAAGFTTPSTGQQLTVTVTSSSLIPFSATVGKNLERAVSVGLTGPAPTSIAVTITSLDPSKVKFAAHLTDLGSDSITVTIPPNFSKTPDFYVQGFDSTGSVAYTISAPNYGSNNGTVTLGPSGFVIDSPGGFGAAQFQVQKGQGNPNITVYVGLLSGGIVTETQYVVPGVSIPVTVESSNTNVGTISTSPINIVAGATGSVTQFQPLNTGSTAITASSAGYQSAQVTASVVPGSIVVFGPAIVGNKLQTGEALLILTQPAGPGGTVVTVHSNSASLLLSVDGTSAGSTDIQITVPQGSTTANFWLQGLADSGTATFTASATGFASGNGSTTLVPSAVIILPDTVSGPVNGAPDVTIFSVALSPDGFVPQVFGGGGPLNVTLQNTNQTIAGTPATVTIPAGASSTTLTISLKKVGGATLSVVQPSGFTTPSSFTTTTVTVTSAPLTITTASLPIGISGFAYSMPVQAVGGGALPYQWSATGLPANLTINPSTGVISGIPTTGGTVAVNVTVTDATSQTASANYSLKIVTPTSITSFAGTPQSATTGSSFGVALKAKVLDGSSNPIAGVPVTFTAPGFGASAILGGNTSTTAMTDASGVATSPVPVANGTAGSYNVTASVGALSTQFALTNVNP